MTTLHVPTMLEAAQARRFLERELRHREVDSVKVRGNLVVIEHRPPSIDYATPQDLVEHYGLPLGTIII